MVMKFPFPMPFAVMLCAISTAGCEPQARTGNPEAVGTVKWGRDYDAAVAAAKTTGKPVFALFQEVPGCAGCRQFGRDVLSDPSVVKMIQENFIPLLIHNNKPGMDAEILARFDEPAWNYQVVRFLDAVGHDIIPRKDRVWEAPELKQRMTLALKMKPTGIKRVAIAQSCFWAGEMKIGAIDGVKCTEAGFIDGNEVTLVDFDSTKISADDLTKKAKAAGVATRVFTSLDGYAKAPDADQKRQIQGTKYSRLDLTPEQATKVNAFARTDPARADALLAK